MRHASLFTGIGGFDLAAHWMGWENVLQCEIDPFCTKVLEYHFPTTTHYGDIRDIDGTQWTGKIDILTGGFPCQPFSAAGRRRGTEDNRFLWPEMLRVIREIKPAWIVAENVRGITSIDNGMVFERVCSELEENEYEVQPFCIPACAVDAPHKRERIWFVANLQNKQCEWGECSRGGGRKSEEETGNRDSDVADTKSKQNRRQDKQGIWEHNTGNSWRENWLQAATRLCRVDDGLSRELDGITIPKWRRESLKAYGNAIVPQIAYQIFQAMESSYNRNFPAK